MKTLLSVRVGASLLLFGTFSLSAKVTLPSLLSDHMVLQQGKPVAIWGTADPQEAVTVEFAGQSKPTVADGGGNWSVKLDPLTMNKTGADLTVKGTNVITLKDVLVGEVWLASGQSNMGFSLASAHNAAEALPQATDDLLRFFMVKTGTATEPQANVPGGRWFSCDPTSARPVSAVAYFCAREIRAHKDCPVGVIQASWGGTSIQIWMSRNALETVPPVQQELDQLTKALEAEKKCEENPQIETDYKAAFIKWQTEGGADYEKNLKQWNADKAAGKEVGPRPQLAQPEPKNPNPFVVINPAYRPWVPTCAFNAMIHPLRFFALAGALWYQGENNAGQGLEYRDLLPRLIRDWRTQWGYDFPFIYVQLPCNGKNPKPVAESGWPWLREAQLMALSVPNTGMAVTIDIGDPANVHPSDKYDVGERLSLVVRKVAYHENIVACGPLYKDFTVDGDKMKIRFTETGSGLTPGQAPWHPAGVDPLPTDKLTGFFIAGEDKQWVEASATIEGDVVIVSGPQVPKPVAVRYGWSNSPRCNLYNKEGLAASPFRTDTW